jgi:hypothetical protein
LHLTGRAALCGVCLGLVLVATGCGSHSRDEEAAIERTVKAFAIGDDPAVCRTHVSLAFLEATTGANGGEALSACERTVASPENAEAVSFQDIELHGAEATVVVSFKGGTVGGQGVEIALKKAGGRWQLTEYKHFTHLDKAALATVYRRVVETGGASRAQGACVARHMRHASKRQLEEEVLGGYSPTLRVKEYEGCPP